MAIFPASRETRRFAGAVLAGCISATLFSVALNHAQSLVFFLVYTTALPLFVVGLGVGAVGGVVASMAGFADLIIREPSNYAVIYAFVYALPAVVLTALALRYRVGEDQKTYWYPEGYLLTGMALYPCVLFLILCAIGSSHEGGLLALTHETIDKLMESLPLSVGADEAKNIAAFYHEVERYIPAGSGVAWTLITMINMVAGQNAVQRHGWNQRARFALRDLYLPGWIVIAVAVTGLVSVLTNDPYSYIGENLAVMLGFPFLFVGLAIVHAWAHMKTSPVLILIAFYLGLVVLPFLVLVTAILGAADQWVNFRQRFINQAKST